uniref:Uncharacterized protein n=1 Tax=viral metagenome TaxID=1070528 RepID=A0A6M3LBA3_9ZZZZ
MTGYRGTPGDSYKPSNGCEGIDFMDQFCAHCVKDKALNGEKDPDICDGDDYCGIIAASMLYKIHNKGYPPEWVYDDEGLPTCTAFEAVPEPDQSVTLSECEHCLTRWICLR